MIKFDSILPIGLFILLSFYAHTATTEKERETELPEKQTDVIERGTFQSVKSAPGVILLEVSKSDGSTKFLLTPSLIEASIFGPPKIGDTLSWVVTNADSKVFIPELSLTIDSLSYVKFITELPKRGTIVDFVVNERDAHWQIRVNQDPLRVVNIITDNGTLPTDLKSGDRVSWHETNLLSRANSTNPFATLRVTRLTKVNN